MVAQWECVLQVFGGVVVDDFEFDENDFVLLEPELVPQA